MFQKPTTRPLLSDLNGGGGGVGVVNINGSRVGWAGLKMVCSNPICFTVLLKLFIHIPDFYSFHIIMAIFFSVFQFTAWSNRCRVNPQLTLYPPCGSDLLKYWYITPCNHLQYPEMMTGRYIMQAWIFLYVGDSYQSLFCFAYFHRLSFFRKIFEFQVCSDL